MINVFIDAQIVRLLAPQNKCRVGTTQTTLKYCSIFTFFNLLTPFLDILPTAN